MGAGLIQLLFFGQQDIYLKSNPSITFFKKVFKTHTNFSMESIHVEFTSSTLTNIYQPTTLQVKIPRHGDLIGQIYLVLDIPEIISDNVLGFQWIENLGEAIIDNYYITVGGSLVDRQYGDYLHILNNLTLSSDKRKIYDKIICNTIQFNNPKQYSLLINNLSNIPQRYRIGNQYPMYVSYDPNNPTVYTPSIKTQKMYIPLQFWFNRDLGSALPLVALQYSEVELTIVLRPWNQLYTLYYNKNGIQDYYAPSPYIQAHQMSNFVSNVKQNFLVSDTTINCQCYLEINYIYLDTLERQFFAYKPLDYLIDQVTRVIEYGVSQTHTTNLILQNPVKEILWQLQRSDVDIKNDWFNYLDNNNQIMATAKILFNGIDRIQEKDFVYFNYIQPFQHHSANNKDGLFNYSFSIEPENFQPSGSCNMSRINNIQFFMTCNAPSDSSYVYNATFYIINYNFLRLNSGMAGVVFNL